MVRTRVSGTYMDALRFTSPLIRRQVLPAPVQVAEAVLASVPAVEVRQDRVRRAVEAPVQPVLVVVAMDRLLEVAPPFRAWTSSMLSWQLVWIRIRSSTSVVPVARAVVLAILFSAPEPRRCFVP